MALDVLQPIEISDTLLTPKIGDLTTKSVDGTGVFDVLMKVVKLHLLEEYNAGRITGNEYSQVYLGALSQVLQQSITFLLNHQTTLKTAAEIGLIRQQTATELAQTDDAVPVGLAFNDTTEIQGLVALQKAKVEKEGQLIDNQIAMSATEKALIGQKIITELAQTSDDFSQVGENAPGFNSDITLGGMLAAAKAMTQMEERLVEQKIVTEVAQTSETKPITLGEMSATSVIEGMVKMQKNKVKSEGYLLGQKTVTEFAQTGNQLPASIPEGLYTLTPGNALVDGVIKKQKNLFSAQTTGFQRDAEQKAAKIMVDAFSVDASMGNTSGTTTNKLDSPNIGSVMQHLFDGITSGWPT